MPRGAPRGNRNAAGPHNSGGTRSKGGPAKISIPRVVKTPEPEKVKYHPGGIYPAYVPGQAIRPRTWNSWDD